MESDTAYLARTLEVETAADAARIDEVFEFVADDSDLTIEALAEPPSAAHPAARRSEPTAADTAPGAAPALTGSIRVNLEKVDRLLNMVGEIVITQAMLSQQINSLQLGRHPELVQELEQMAHHVRELQENVMSIRAQPVRSVFARMPRPVRELADELGKEARVVTVGEGTEVDKTVIEQLSDPLTHLVRNAVDHGRGSRFSVSLPLTLAVLDGMIVTVASERYIVPLTNIIESLRPRASDISRLGPGRDVLAIRGAYVPLVYLARALHTGRAITDPTQGLVVLVEAEGDEKLVIVVDEMLGQQQMVIKSLVSNYRQIAGISAATILGDGRVALILDVGGLRQLEATPALEPMPEQALVA
jgi:chemotaxis protein histidine kinase CheA